ncbi:MAG: DegV family protein [Lachnospiraceae bacterium]
MIIITDSASDITRNEAAAMNVKIVPLTITFEFGICPQESEEDFQLFFQHLEKADKLPTTSQPSPECYLKEFQLAKEQGEDVLVITLSSGLSGTINSATIAKNLCEYDKIHIVDSRQAIITQRMLVEKAVSLRESGKNIFEIEQELINVRDQLYVCGMLDTLKYLKMGGRIPAAMAYLGELLKIKPMIALKDKILVEVGLSKGRISSMRKLMNELGTCTLDPEWPVYFGYTVDKEFGEKFMMEVVAKYNLKNYKLYQVGGVIGTHVGPNCIALAFKKL